MATAGPSSECFFVGRAELLAWVNGLLSTNLSKVEAVRPSQRGYNHARTRSATHAELETHLSVTTRGDDTHTHAGLECGRRVDTRPVVLR